MEQGANRRMQITGSEITDCVHAFPLLLLLFFPPSGVFILRAIFLLVLLLKLTVQQNLTLKAAIYS